MLTYWCLAGIICFIKLQFPLAEEEQERIEEIMNSMPISEEELKIIVPLLALLLGGIFLPITLSNRIYKFFTGKDLF